MGRIEIHPRTFERNFRQSPRAQRRFLETPDVTIQEELPAIGSTHPEYAALVCVSITKTTGHGNDPSQTLYVLTYEAMV